MTEPLAECGGEEWEDILEREVASLEFWRRDDPVDFYAGDADSGIEGARAMVALMDELRARLVALFPA